MRKGLLSTVATALVGAGSVFAQSPDYLPGEPPPLPAAYGQTAGTPVLLPADPQATTTAPAPAPSGAAAAPVMSGGSTGLRPGVDCLPEPANCNCRRGPRFYGDVAYLLMWMKDAPSGPPIAGVPPGGRFGSPGTIILDGGERIDYGTFNGVMATTGVWLNDHVGIESSGFVTEHRSDTFGVSDFGATGPLSIVRPIALPSGGAFAPGVVGVPVAVPGALAGGVLRSASARLWGADGDLVFNLRSSCQSRLDLLAGFAYYDLRETLATNQSTVNVGPGPAPGTGVNTADLFDTRNQFYGGQLGTRWTATRGRLSLSWVSKIALGDSHESVDRQGTTVVVSPTGSFGLPGGLLVGPFAGGRDTRDQFAVVLPSTFQLGYQVTDHLNAFVGYTYVYWSSVARPGDQITSASGAGGPAVGVNPTDFTASGFTFGMGYKW